MGTETRFSMAGRISFCSTRRLSWHRRSLPLLPASDEEMDPGKRPFTSHLFTVQNVSYTQTQVQKKTETVFPSKVLFSASCFDPRDGHILLLHILLGLLPSELVCYCGGIHHLKTAVIYEHSRGGEAAGPGRSFGWSAGVPLGHCLSSFSRDQESCLAGSFQGHSGEMKEETSRDAGCLTSGLRTATMFLPPTCRSTWFLLLSPPSLLHAKRK